MTESSYTLKSNGLAVRSDTGDIFSQWWTKSPEKTDGIGNFYQVKATININQISEDGILSGVFNKWVSLSQDQSWRMESLTGKGGISIFIQIRETFSMDIVEDALIILGFIDQSEIGDYYWNMNFDYGTYFERNNDSKIFQAPLSMIPGSTLSTVFTLNPTNDIDVFFDSSPGSPNPISFSIDNLNIITLTGCTATLNGVAVINGVTKYPNANDDGEFGIIGSSAVIEITSTTTGDIEYIGGDNTGSIPLIVTAYMYDVNYSGPDGLWHWGLDSVISNIQPEDSGGTNIIYEGGLIPSFFKTINVVKSSSQNDYELTFNQRNDLVTYPSMRSDDSGSSTRYNNTAYHQTKRIITQNAGSFFVPYSDGFTIECIVSPLGIVDRGTTDGSIANCISAMKGHGGVNPLSSLWVMNFENWGDPTVNVLYPTFALIDRGQIYRSAGIAPSNALIRSTTPMILSNVYHLMATIRPSNNTIEFWVDGVSVGTDTISSGSTWFTPGILGDSDDLIQGTRETFMAIGNGYFDGGFFAGDSAIQDVKVHLLEADDDFAKQQAVTTNSTN